uniref:Centromere-associated protein E n=1 Tax=Cricetulus griseus TaxID=10029 RepID=A0A8C2QPZ7_CRIGR
MTLRGPIGCDAEDILNFKAGPPVRELWAPEEELGEDAHVYWKTDKNTIYQSDGGKSFNFDRVFHSNETTKNVYEEIAVPIINSAIQGYNGTIFAYGQTASGKTHTMMGSEDCLGVIPRAIHDIFQRIKKFPEREFLLRVSYMEIYNETITDLLCNAQKTKPLIIREDINRNVYVADLTEEVVNTAEVALKWITMGEKNRHYGITKMNQRSSRSHTIFRMILESREKGESSNCDGSIKVSHLNLVDLAGSERAAQTGAEGVRLKEGCNINRSLFILGQVIKKLSDEQFGGFINYRDSKLTRILQNSLGGNAKTRIICTITPVSFDETLTTLQVSLVFISFHCREWLPGKMVNTKTRAQEMEKDQLAQLLDEKDLLQKVQDEKIQNLKRMLVTSSSIAFQQELKVKKKRRVTWCYGKINKMKDSNYVNEFKVPTNVTTRANKTSVTLLGENSLMRLGENDESLPIESDVFNNTLEPLTEVEWSSATKLLGEENVESELSSLHAQYDDLVLDYEQLRRENEELKLKLKEKNDLEEFEALERKAEKDQENEISSKVELLKEKEDQIKDLQKYIDAQKSEKMKIDLSYSSEPTEELKQVMQTLSDMDTVALDAKREAAFLRSENLRLQEKINELSDSCKQMENDTQAYQRQLEAKKKMQVDLDKELQFAFQEISKLTALVEGKGLQSNLELEKKITDLQRELNKEAEDKEILQKEVSLLSELKSLPSEVEMLRRELHEKSEELCFITSEREHLFSEVAHKDSRIQGLLEEIGNAKDDLAASQLNYKSRDEACQTLKTLHMELEQKYQVVLEESERMKQEIGNLSKEAEKLGLSLDSLNAEVVLTERLQQALEEVRVLTQEKEDLKQLQASLQTERDQLKSDIQDTVNMSRYVTIRSNVDTQEQLLNALESLKQHQETINQLKMKAAEETSKNLHTKDRGGTGDEIQQKMNDVDEEQNLLAGNAQTLIAGVNDNEVTEEKRKIHSLMQENNGLQQTLESIIAEKEQLKMDLQENIEMTIENQEELRALRDELKRQQEVATQEKDIATKKSEELSRVCERLAEVEEELKEKNQKLQEKQQQLVSAEEDMSEMQQRMTATEKSQRLALEYVEAERLELTQKLHENCEKMKSLTKERNELSELQESFELERRQLKEYVREMEAIRLQTEEELNTTRTHLKEHQEIIEELRSSLTGKEAQIASTKDTEKSRTQWQEEHLETEEELNIAHCCLKEQEKKTDALRVRLSQKETELSSVRVQLESATDELERKVQELNEKQEQLNIKETSESQEKMNELDQVKALLLAKDSTLQRIESDRLQLTKQLEESQEEMRVLIKERDELKRIREALDVENEQQKENIKEIGAKLQELQDKERECLVMKTTEETQGDACEMECLTKQLEAQKSTLERVEMENANLTQRLHETLEEMGSVAKERDELRSLEERLTVERDQLKESLKETATRGLEKEEELRVARVHLQEHQETIVSLRESVSAKADEMSRIQGDLAHTHTALEVQSQELQEKAHQLSQVKAELKETVDEMEQLKKQLEAQNSTLENIEIEKLKLTQQVYENLEKIRLVTKENDDLKVIDEALRVEQDQLRKSLQQMEANDLEKQEKLRIAHLDLKEHQETIDRLRGVVSKKTAEVSNMEMELENANIKLQEKIQELKANEGQLLKLKGAAVETQKQLKEQGLALNKIEIENLNLAQKLHENLEEMKSVIKERDNLKRVEEMLKLERDQLKENLRDTKWKDHQNHEEIVKHAKRLLYDGEQHSTESLREKCLRIKELLKRYSEMGNEYECLNSFSIDWEKETKTQKELALAIKAKLSLPHPQTKEIEKLLTTNHRCSMEFHRILKKLKEVEKQNELRIKIQSFQQVYDIPSKDLENLKLSQDMDLHIEEIAKDFAENGFPTIKTEFQQVLSNRKEITQFLGRWMNTPFDTEKLKSGIQRENNSICQVNNFYNSKIIAMINESTEFEEGNAAKCKELEHYLKSLKEKTKQLSKDYETLTVSRSAAHVHTTTQPSTQGSKNPHIASVGEQLTSEKIQELETSLQEAKKSAMHKEGQIAKMQKELAMSKDLVAKLQSEVHESNKCLENTKATVQKLQDKVALGAVPYKEEIEDLKMQLVKIDLEKKENAKEFEKEILSTKATVTHQKEVIRMLRENLRRNQQAQDTSMVSEPDSQTLRKPLTCGGGSGIVQSTKALILKSEYIRMENEISKLKQQNEQLVKQNNRLLSDKSQLSKKLETMKERTLKRDTYRESACENSPKSPKVTGADSKRRQNTPSQCRERNFQDSPKSLFSDNRAKSLPAPYPVCYFDNSALGLCPEEPAVEAENVNPKTDLYQPSSGKDGPECKMQ